MRSIGSLNAVDNSCEASSSCAHLGIIIVIISKAIAITAAAAFARAGLCVG